MIRIKNNENFNACKACGGQCCNNLPGCAYPEDFGFHRLSKKKILEKLVSMFQNGWQIDWWDHYNEINPDYQGYFIRPATKRDPFAIYHAAWGGEGCVFNFKEQGCRLPFNERPFGCKVLVPSTKGSSHCHWPKKYIPESLNGKNKLIAIEKWWPYEKLIIQAADVVIGETE